MTGVSHGVHRARERYLIGAKAWMDRGGQDALQKIGTIRVPEFLLFFGIIFEGSYGLPIPVDISQLFSVFLCVLIIFRRPLFDLGVLQRYVPAFAAALLYVGLVSLMAEHTPDALDWTRRLIRMILIVLTIFSLASGRIDLRSGLLGLFSGTVFNVVTFYAGLAPDHYGGVLSGWFYDKNVAGLGHAVYGFLAIFAFEKTWTRFGAGAFAVMATYLTGSRTSIAALSAAIVWYFVAPRLPLIGRWLLGVAIYFVVDLLQEDFSQVGQFSGREGSDELRERIDAASLIRVHETPFFGQGLGEAYVHIQDSRWFFHNSYWTAFVEGGWPWLIFLLVFTILVAGQPFTRKLTKWEYAAQASTVALLICAWRLGEVFMTIQWAMVMAFALQARWTSKQDKQLELGPRSFDATLDPRKTLLGSRPAPDRARG